jgi:hypothetical protein
MRKTTKVALCATAAAMAWGLISIRPTSSEPGIKKVEVETISKTRRIASLLAEDDPRIDEARISMREWCADDGLNYLVWVEREENGRLAVFGRCRKG